MFQVRLGTLVDIFLFNRHSALMRNYLLDDISLVKIRALYALKRGKHSCLVRIWPVRGREQASFRCRGLE